MSYARGWRDGAGSHTKRREFLESARYEIRSAYTMGYEAGHDAYNRDLSAWAAEVGYDVAKGVLRWPPSVTRA